MGAMFALRYLGIELDLLRLEHCYFPHNLKLD
jgi:hypothetical protein